MSSAAQKVIPFQRPTTDPSEPPFPSVDQMFSPPVWGKYDHDEAWLREMWSRIWRCFKSRKMCEGFVQKNKLLPKNYWIEAFEEVRQGKEKLDHINYVFKIGSTYFQRGTPSERAIKTIEDARKAAANTPLAVLEEDDPTRKYWAERGRRKSLDDVPDDDPVVLRMAARLKGVK